MFCWRSLCMCPAFFLFNVCGRRSLLWRTLVISITFFSPQQQVEANYNKESSQYTDQNPKKNWKKKNCRNMDINYNLCLWRVKMKSTTYLPMWSCSPKTKYDRIATKTVPRGLNMLTNTGPFCSIVHIWMKIIKPQHTTPCHSSPMTELGFF